MSSVEAEQAAQKASALSICCRQPSARCLRLQQQHTLGGCGVSWHKMRMDILIGQQHVLQAAQREVPAVPALAHNQ